MRPLDLCRNAYATRQLGQISVFTRPGSRVAEAVGLSKDGWQVQLYGQNLAHKRAQLFESAAQSYTAITVNRPRMVGLQVSYRIGGDQS